MKKQFVTNSWAIRCALAGFSLMSITAFAQDAESDNVIATDSNSPVPATPEAGQPTNQTNRLPIVVTASLSQQFNSDMDKGGDVGITRSRIAVAVPIRLNDDLVLASAFRYGLDYFNFNNQPTSASAPINWDYINTLTLSSVLRWKINDNWSAYGGGFVRMSAESGTALNGGASGGGVLGANYKQSDTLSYGLGLVVMSQLEDDAKVLPLPSLKWKFDDNWLLNVGLNDVSTLGYGADLSWLFSQEVTFDLGAQYHNSRFRINGTGAYQNGIGQEKSTTIYLNTKWRASEHVSFNGYVGVAAGGNVRVENSSGNNEIDSNYNTAAIIGGSVALSF